MCGVTIDARMAPERVSAGSGSGSVTSSASAGEAPASSAAGDGSEVDKAAARGVDDDGRALSSRRARARGQMAVLGNQRRVERDEVGLGDRLLGGRRGSMPATEVTDRNGS